jgi:hypothetical protein
VALLIACVEYDTGDRAELTLEAGDTPNYYCLVLRTALAAAPRVAAALTRGGLCPDATRWRYRGFIASQCSASGPALARMPTR